jgi:hypothetical protein
MNKGKKKEKDYACCDENTLTCDACSFEESIKVDAEENEK